MSTILHLTRRTQPAIGVTIDPRSIAQLMAMAANPHLLPDAKDALWQAVSNAAKIETVHDKHWLLLIANWTPPDDAEGRARGGLPFVDQARWTQLALRIYKLDDSKTGNFTLSNSQAELIFNRLCDKRFLMAGTQPAWLEFTRAFFEAYDKWPENRNKDDDFDAEFEADEANVEVAPRE